MLSSGPAVAQTTNPMGGSVLTQVVAVGSYGDQSIFVMFQDVISGCSGRVRIDLAANHPARDNVYSVAITAFSTGTSVRVRPDLCDGDIPIFDSTKNSFLYLDRR